MRIVIGLIVSVVFALGFARLWFDSPQLKPIHLEGSTRLAECLKPQGEIPIGTPITLRSLPSEPTAPATTLAEAPPGLEFVTTGPMEVDLLPDDPTRKKADQKTSTRPAVTVTKSAGSFEFRLWDGSFLVSRSNIPFLLQSHDLVRFGPTAVASYVVTLLKDIKPDDGKKTATLPVGTKGVLQIGAGQALEPLQPLNVSNWLMGIPSTLSAVRVSGQAGLADVAIEVRQAGVAFDAAGFSLGACASVDSGKSWTPAGVAETKARETGFARVLVVLPAGSLVDNRFWIPLEVAVASPDGKYRGYGGFKAISKGWAAAIAILTTALLLWWLLTLRSEQLVKDRGVRESDTGRWITGLFIGPDNEPSLSLFQIFIWTTITVWGFIYVYLVSGSLLTMTIDMMGLLGIAGAGTVAARWLGSRETASTPQGIPTQSLANASTDLVFWRILSTNGHFDLLKLQLFLFTVTIAAYVVYRILDSAAFPVLDANTLLLLGVSQGVYIGGKVAGTTALANAQTLKIDLDVKNDVFKKLSAEQSALESDKLRLDEKKEKGQLVDRIDIDRLNALPGLIEAKKKEVDEAKGKFDKTKADYDKAVKELFPTPA